MFIPAFTTNAMTSDFLLLIFPWLSDDIPRYHTYGVNISHVVRFAKCCTSVLNFHSKNLQITSKTYWHRVTYFTSFEKHLESSSGHALSFYLNVKYRFKNMLLKESFTRSSTVI